MKLSGEINTDAAESIVQLCRMLSEAKTELLEAHAETAMARKYWKNRCVWQRTQGGTIAVKRDLDSTSSGIAIETPAFEELKEKAAAGTKETPTDEGSSTLSSHVSTSPDLDDSKATSLTEESDISVLPTGDSNNDGLFDTEVSFSFALHLFASWTSPYGCY